MGVAQIRSETDQAHPVYRNEADASKLKETRQTDGMRSSRLFVEAPSLLMKQTSETSLRMKQRGCEQHLSCNRVLFVERSGELRVQEWLRA